MKTRIVIPVFALLLSLPLLGYSQAQWPKEIPYKNGGKITIYQPQPEDLKEGVLVSRMAVSVKKSGQSEPVFGVVWTEGTVRPNGSRDSYSLSDAHVFEARFPETEEAHFVEEVKFIVSRELRAVADFMARSELDKMLKVEKETTMGEISTEAPTIIYTDKPTLLVNIDGQPFLKHDQEMNMERVMNSPSLIVRNPDDRMYYLYGEGMWYQSSAILGGWRPANRIPSRIAALDRQINEYKKENNIGNNAQENATYGPYEIFVSTEPVELIQSDGMPEFASVEGTSLLYMTNTYNSIFMHIDTQKYYLLLSGRWYVALKLHGPWGYTPADRLPADFARIPEGSDVDGVLANVAGTDAAREAVLDTYVPQTARVDRNSASATVVYDGEPAFEPIRGTNLYYAVNSPTSVIRYYNQYYVVDNGVWFVSNRPQGPWAVAVERPYEVAYIPASYPVYNMRYVYIYDVTPQYVYMGYTQGYLGSYVHGPTVVYGTGYYYRPWYGRYYYARPATWGFGMYYNPWAGWTMSYGYSVGWFSFHYHRNPGWGCWWGPAVYRPAYRPFYRGGWYHHSYYRPVHTHVHKTVIVNNYYNNNVYRSRRDVVTQDRYRHATGSTRITSRPTSVRTSDRSGEIRSRSQQDTRSRTYTTPQSRTQQGANSQRRTTTSGREGTTPSRVQQNTTRSGQSYGRTPQNTERSATPNYRQGSNGSRSTPSEGSRTGSQPQQQRREAVSPSRGEAQPKAPTQNRVATPSRQGASSPSGVNRSPEQRSSAPSRQVSPSPSRSSGSSNVQRNASPQRNAVRSSGSSQRSSAPSVKQRSSSSRSQGTSSGRQQVKSSSRSASPANSSSGRSGSSRSNSRSSGSRGR